MARWSPSGHALAVVRDNDLYYLPDIAAQAERLTNSGRQGLIFNGIADWLYEGMVFGNCVLEKVTFPRNRKIGHLSIDFPTLCASKTPIYAATESSFFFKFIGHFQCIFWTRDHEMQRVCSGLKNS